MLEDCAHPSQQYGVGDKNGIQPFVGSFAPGTSQQLKEVYIVHYNGYCFGANFAKMVIIREREAKQDSQDFSDLSDQSDDSEDSCSQSEASQPDLAKIIKVEEEVSVISSD